MSRVTRTTKAAIAAYWLGTPEGTQRFPENEARFDPEWPACFACGFPALDEEERPPSWKAWNKAALDRCHIRPRSIGGSDDPTNLVLLCSSCHRDSPNVGDPSYMIKWMTERGTSIDRFFELLERTLDTHELREDFARVAEFGDRGKMFAEVYGGLRRSWAGTHGWYTNESTEEAVLAEAIKQLARVPSPGLDRGQTPTSSTSTKQSAPSSSAPPSPTDPGGPPKSNTTTATE